VIRMTLHDIFNSLAPAAGYGSTANASRGSTALALCN
jgi:hypothetical protein